jgi:predicted Zn-dependent peptidase
MKHLLTLLSLGFLTSVSMADVFIDHELDPVPLVEIQVVLPRGFEADSPAEVGLGNLIPEILEEGTITMNREAFKAALAQFGASQAFEMGNLYSTWKLTFPFVEGKDYEKLISIVETNWKQPRFLDDAFKKALFKFKANLQASLDRDFALASGAARRFVNLHHFGGDPAFIESFDRIKLKDVEAHFVTKVRAVKNVWIGVIAPDAQMPLVEKLVGRVFSTQGKVVKGQRFERMRTEHRVRSAQNVNQKTVIIVDKPERNQSVTLTMAVRPKEIQPEEELAYFVGSHIFFDSGLGSVFADEIRNKQGLAYAVGSGGGGYLTYPMISLSMNPLKDKSDAAFKTANAIFERGYASDALIKELPGSVWNNFLQSFRYQRALQRATPTGRLSERQSVVVGGMSEQFFKSSNRDWTLTRKALSKQLQALYKDSVKVVAIVGSAEMLRPLVKMNFPEHRVLVIPYQKSLSKDGYALTFE